MAQFWDAYPILAIKAIAGENETVKISNNGPAMQVGELRKREAIRIH
ncbi:MAG: hypothetical protein ACREYF_19320 [Gammaproteobacteria bacterium]